MKKAKLKELRDLSPGTLIAIQPSINAKDFTMYTFSKLIIDDTAGFKSFNIEARDLRDGDYVELHAGLFENPAPSYMSKKAIEKYFTEEKISNIYILTGENRIEMLQKLSHLATCYNDLNSKKYTNERN